MNPNCVSSFILLAIKNALSVLFRVHVNVVTKFGENSIKPIISYFVLSLFSNSKQFEIFTTCNIECAPANVT
jgi:hypothetical protein